MLVNYSRLQQIEKELLLIDKQLKNETSENAMRHLQEKAIKLEQQKEEILYPNIKFGKRKYDDFEEG